LAISRRCTNVPLAADYVEFVASSQCQRGLYFDSGGQPGHRSAWEDARVNSAANGFFDSTLETLDNAYLRPRYDGYIEFQNQAGTIIHAFLRDGTDAQDVITSMQALA